MTMTPTVPPGGEELWAAAATLLYPGLFPHETYRRHPAQVERVVAAMRDGLAAQEAVARVEAEVKEWAAEPLAYRFGWHVARIRRALAGDS